MVEENNSLKNKSKTIFTSGFGITWIKKYGKIIGPELVWGNGAEIEWSRIKLLVSENSSSTGEPRTKLEVSENVILSFKDIDK